VFLIKPSAKWKISNVYPSLYVFLAVVAVFITTGCQTHTFVIGDKAFLLDGKPLQIRCGEIHMTQAS